MSASFINLFTSQKEPIQTFSEILTPAICSLEGSFDSLFQTLSKIQSAIKEWEERSKTIGSSFHDTSLSDHRVFCEEKVKEYISFQDAEDLTKTITQLFKKTMGSCKKLQFTQDAFDSIRASGTNPEKFERVQNIVIGTISSLKTIEISLKELQDRLEKDRHQKNQMLEDYCKHIDNNTPKPLEASDLPAPIEGENFLDDSKILFSNVMATVSDGAHAVFERLVNGKMVHLNRWIRRIRTEQNLPRNRAILLFSGETQKQESTSEGIDLEIEKLEALELRANTLKSRISPLFKKEERTA